MALRGVRIFIEATPPRSSEVQVDLQAKGLRASVLQRVVGVEGELRTFVAGYVRRELDKPHVRQARLIDVSRAIDTAWASLAPAPAAQDAGDRRLNDELEREIRHHEETFASESESGAETGVTLRVG